MSKSLKSLLFLQGLPEDGSGEGRFVDRVFSVETSLTVLSSPFFTLTPLLFPIFWLELFSELLEGAVPLLKKSVIGLLDMILREIKKETILALTTCDVNIGEIKDL